MKGSINSPFVNDMFGLVYKAFERVFPGRACKCIWVEHIYLDEETGQEVWGQTTFPEDGSLPVVEVSGELAVKDAVEVFAHELAHVGVGEECVHDEVWEDAFGEIYREYMNVCFERMEDK